MSWIVDFILGARKNIASSVGTQKPKSSANAVVPSEVQSRQKKAENNLQKKSLKGFTHIRLSFVHSSLFAK